MTRIVAIVPKEIRDDVENEETQVHAEHHESIDRSAQKKRIKKIDNQNRRRGHGRIQPE